VKTLPEIHVTLTIYMTSIIFSLALVRAWARESEGSGLGTTACPCDVAVAYTHPLSGASGDAYGPGRCTFGSAGRAAATGGGGKISSETVPPHAGPQCAIMSSSVSCCCVFRCSGARLLVNSETAPFTTSRNNSAPMH
jgi:hypothetical protein